VAYFLWRTFQKMCLSREYKRMKRDIDDTSDFGEFEMTAYGVEEEEDEISWEEQEEIDQISFILPQAY